MLSALQVLMEVRGPFENHEIETTIGWRDLFLTFAGDGVDKGENPHPVAQEAKKAVQPRRNGVEEKGLPPFENREGSGPRELVMLYS